MLYGDWLQTVIIELLLSLTIVCVIVQDGCKAIVQLLLPKYIQVPQGARLKAIVDGFEAK